VGTGSEIRALHRVLMNMVGMVGMVNTKDGIAGCGRCIHRGTRK
jgi:hypothetical protein